MTYRKKLIEVALPLEAINKASAREKSIRHGHPSTLHLWWARRPLAACRAVLFASLVDDPDSDPQFKDSPDAAATKRAELFDLIEELVLWKNSNNADVLNRARAEIARCVASRKIETSELTKDEVVFGPGKGEQHPAGALSGAGVTAWEVAIRHARPEVVDAFLVEHAPPVVDPFCGGGSIPLEAQRLGLRAQASDLNPVPVLITKALIEIPPKFAGLPPVNPDWQRKCREEKAARVWQGAQGLAEDIRFYGSWARDEAEGRIGHLYPKIKVTAKTVEDRPDLQKYIGKELTVVAWLWARTVASPDPVCQGAHVPLVKSFNISTRKGNAASVEPIVDRLTNTIAFRVQGKPGSTRRTIGRKGGTCLITGTPIPFDYIRREGKAARLGTRLLAVVAASSSERVYLAPTEDLESMDDLPVVARVPDAEMAHNPFSLRPPLYGLDSFADLFTKRQITTLCTFSDLVEEARTHARSAAADSGMPTGPGASDADRMTADSYADAIATYLAFAVGRGADYWSTGATWEPSSGIVGHTFTRQALPMVWDFCEANPIGNASGNWMGAIDWIARVIEKSVDGPQGIARQLDASHSNSETAQCLVSTDPPYYNNVDYADLSDYFYVWLRRTLFSTYPELFSTLLTPKSHELVATPYRFDNDREKARRFFESGLAAVFRCMKGLQQCDLPLTVYYAFKQAENDQDDSREQSAAGSAAIASTGWETMLAGLIDTGFTISGTWPMRTERGARSMSIKMNALASSIVLVCRPRLDDAPLTTRKDYMNALRQELPGALKNLQHGNIAPVDLAQAAIGPGMAVFTRYAKVMETDGSAMTVRTALGIINKVLDEVLAEQEGEFDADTRWALAWFEQFGTDEGVFGVAETLSKAKNTSVKGLEEAGILTAHGGRVRLLGRDELPEDWDPASDDRLTIWEVVQHLIRLLETEGEAAAATLVKHLGGAAETARDLAYRLYTISERKKWAQEAMAFNGLVIAWPELSRLALAVREEPSATQEELFS